MRILLTLFCCCCLGAAPGPVLFMSFDGIGAKLFTARTMPKVWKLAQEGWRGEGLPPFPSTTFAGHATLATGCWPEHHGIVGNRFQDPRLGSVPYAAKAELLEREPLWIAAAHSGVKTAVYHWPCGTAPWRGQAPWRMEFYAKQRADEEALDFCGSALDDGARLVMAYLSGADAEGHRHGPDSPEVREKLLRTDALLAPWLEAQLTRHPGLRIVLTSDHGMLAATKRISLPELLGRTALHIDSQGGSALITVRPGRLEEAERRLADEGLRVWRREALPESDHLKGSPRAGDLVVEAPLGTWLAQETGRKADAERAGRVGVHGYAPEVPDMHAWLVVLGAGKGDLGLVRLWDLAPTVGAWLGVTWRQPPDGRPVAALAN
ncbi:MAG TPA: alkaline phosphatase family protein [Holophagaceae bacterium]|nr:alkaline phosphatase family protein [Holophagaceae bacterium]